MFASVSYPKISSRDVLWQHRNTVTGFNLGPKKIKMYPAKPLLTKVVMSVLTVILTSACVLGNGFVAAVITRFKSLRTVPNILVANLALVDLFNAVINIPPYIIYTVLEASWFRGKALAIMTSILNRLFLILNLASMLAMLTNMYLAISIDLKYLGWKTNMKALACVSLIWLVSVICVMLSSIPLLDIDLGDTHVIEYRKEIYKQGRHFVASFMAFFIICGAVVCFQTVRAIKKKKKEVFCFKFTLRYSVIIFVFLKLASR